MGWFSKCKCDEPCSNREAVALEQLKKSRSKREEELGKLCTEFHNKYIAEMQRIQKLQNRITELEAAIKVFGEVKTNEKDSK
jgi:hypothetical protein